MPEIDAAHIARWANDSDFDDKKLGAAAFSDLKTSMSDEEKQRVDQIIAQAQFEVDPDADVIDADFIIETLKQSGCHPAFEYEGVVVGQHAPEELQAKKNAPTL